MSSFDLFVFDLDGTIVDSAKTVLRILNEIRLALKLSPIFLQDIIPCLSKGGEDLIAVAIGDDLNVSKHLKLFRDLYFSEEVLYPGILDFLEHLHATGVNIAICSNKPRNLVEKVLKRHCLSGYFPAIVAGGDPFAKKPSAEGLIQLLNWAKVPAERGILIGDSRIDQFAAQSAGMKFGFYEKGYDDGVLVDSAYLRIQSYFDLFGTKK